MHSAHFRPSSYPGIRDLILSTSFTHSHFPNLHTTLYTCLRTHTKNPYSTRAHYTQTEERLCPIILQIFHAICGQWKLLRGLILYGFRGPKEWNHRLRWVKIIRYPNLGFISLQHQGEKQSSAQSAPNQKYFPGWSEVCGGASVFSRDWFSRSHFYTRSYTPHGVPGGHLSELSAAHDPPPGISASKPA